MMNVRDRSNLHNVFHLLERLAEERCTAFNDVVTAFLRSMFLGKFEHGEKPFSTREDELDIVKSHEIPSAERPSILQDAAIHGYFGVNRDSILGWLTTYEAHPEGTKEPLKRRFSVANRSNLTAFHEWYAEIPAGQYDQSGLYRLLRTLYINKHDFARWVADEFSETPPMLEAIGADFNKAWVNQNLTAHVNAEARRLAKAEGLPDTLIQGLAAIEPNDRQIGIPYGLRELIEEERKRGKTHFNKSAIARYMKATNFPHTSFSSLTRWLRSAM